MSDAIPLTSFDGLKRGDILRNRAGGGHSFLVDTIGDRSVTLALTITAFNPSEWERVPNEREIASWEHGRPRLNDWVVNLDLPWAGPLRLIETQSSGTAYTGTAIADDGRRIEAPMWRFVKCAPPPSSHAHAREDAEIHGQGRFTVGGEWRPRVSGRVGSLATSATADWSQVAERPVLAPDRHEQGYSSKAAEQREVERVQPVHVAEVKLEVMGGTIALPALIAMVAQQVERTINGRTKRPSR